MFVSNPEYVDLHVHTTCSDGTLTPEEVVKLAANEHIKVIAITDHDNANGVARAQKEAEKYGITVIPGIECSTTFEVKNGVRHILGYNIVPDCKAIKDFNEMRQRDREERMKKMISKLNAFGFELTFADVKKFSKTDIVGRPHLAQAMLEKGYVNSRKEAFELYIGKDKRAYVRGTFVSSEDVIFMIKKAGGIPVLAHPLQMKYLDFEDTIKEIKRLVTMGVEGIEVIYSEHDKYTNELLIELANSLGVYITCGSDFHGSNKKIKLGNCLYNQEKMQISSFKTLGKTFI